jgi:hypothetical protein
MQDPLARTKQAPLPLSEQPHPEATRTTNSEPFGATETKLTRPTLHVSSRQANAEQIWNSIHQYPSFSFPIAANIFMIHQTLRLELRITAIYKGLARFSSGVDSCLCSRRCRQIAISPVLTLRYLSEGWNPVSIQHDMSICSGPRRTMQNKHQIVADRDPTIIGRESVSSCYFLLDRYPLWID